MKFLKFTSSIDLDSFKIKPNCSIRTLEDNFSELKKME